MMKSRYLILALLVSLAGCDTGTAPAPAPTEIELTALQQHIKEDAIKELSEGAYSKLGVIEYLSKEYPAEDVKAGVSAMACEADWKLEAIQKAETYGITDKAEIKSRLISDGFTEEEAAFAADAPPQGT